MAETPQTRKPKFSWTTLIIGSGLAASVTALGNLGGTFVQNSENAEIRRCEIAAAILQDETPSPFVDIAGRSELAGLALKRFRRCMEE